ncbi:MAG: HAMP domain-containing sensor histidine kinase [Archangium sp.]|nr:HAMP domain-containing sensor histidine kinase [Archangium sp.]MDP3158274.1 HAMP domain-containing sensor histidine kinase [Archangium sp.]MDP3569840.1 HAMP domain-containing sensor histidine kinase [Archangium sp.]
MRLLTRLLLSHAMPVLVMGLALGVMLVSLVRMTVLLSEVREQELGSLLAGEAMHRGGWGIEVAMRHGLQRCQAGQPAGTMGQTLAARTAALRELLALPQTPRFPSIRAIAHDYVTLAEAVLAAPDVCEGLRSQENLERRWALDEQLTDAWVDGMSGLHSAVTQKDEEARRVGTAAVAVGLASALLALFLGVLIARRLAKLVTEPLGELERVAHRVGRGDFTREERIEGPLEVQQLAFELDKMRARLAELDTLKQSFLASVSHELRTPLSKLREALALLKEGVAGPVTGKQQRLLDIASRNCEREIRTVTTLLDLSRLRAGAPVQFQAGAMLDDAVREACEAHLDEAKEAGVELEVTIEGDVPRASLDQAMLERAVSNLVRNALGVSRRGQKVRVGRTVRATLGQPPVAVVTVRDEGPGLPPQIRDSVFEAFVTQAVDGSPKGVGVGLGLALAREVARAHQGDLELSDSEGPGATFVLWMPLSMAPGRRAGEA